MTQFCVPYLVFYPITGQEERSLLRTDLDRRRFQQASGKIQSEYFRSKHESMFDRHFRRKHRHVGDTTEHKRFVTSLHSIHYVTVNHHLIKLLRYIILLIA